jgi:hypothetical protein
MLFPNFPTTTGQQFELLTSRISSMHRIAAMNILIITFMASPPLSNRASELFYRSNDISTQHIGPLAHNFDPATRADLLLPEI